MIFYTTVSYFVLLSFLLACNCQASSPGDQDMNGALEGKSARKKPRPHLPLSNEDDSGESAQGDKRNEPPPFFLPGIASFGIDTTQDWDLVNESPRTKPFSPADVTFRTSGTTPGSISEILGKLPMTAPKPHRSSPLPRPPRQPPPRRGVPAASETGREERELLTSLSLPALPSSAEIAFYSEAYAIPEARIEAFLSERKMAAAPLPYIDMELIHALVASVSMELSEDTIADVSVATEIPEDQLRVYLQRIRTRNIQPPAHAYTHTSTTPGAAESADSQ